ncbi:MAG: hypothetical protein ACOCUL_03160 [Bacteroidota bacterium]
MIIFKKHSFFENYQKGGGVMNFQNQKHVERNLSRGKKNSLRQPINKKKEPVRTKTAINMAD